MAVDISEGVTAGDIVTKLQRRSRLNKDVVRKRFSTANLAGEGSPRAVSPSDDRPRSPEVVDAGEQFLFEIGGNIGERERDRKGCKKLCLEPVSLDKLAHVGMSRLMTCLYLMWSIGSF